MNDQLQDALRDVARDGSKELTEEVRQAYISNVRKDIQGESGLEEYVTEVEQDRDDRGRFIGEFVFRVEHPFAPLHETGATVEPTYTKAKAMGWTRDEMYEALEDCNEWVTRKNHLDNAIDEVRE